MRLRQNLLYSCLWRVLKPLVFWCWCLASGLGSFLHNLTNEFTFFLLTLISFFFYSMDSQVWSSGCIPDFLEGLVLFRISFLYACLRVLFSWFCSAWNSFFLHRLLVMLPGVVFIFIFLFYKLLLGFLEFLLGYFSVFQFPCWIFWTFSLVCPPFCPFQKLAYWGLQ